MTSHFGVIAQMWLALFPGSLQTPSCRRAALPFSTSATPASRSASLGTTLPPSSSPPATTKVPNPDPFSLCLYLYYVCNCVYGNDWLLYECVW
jgi:hypothetical protein